MMNESAEIRRTC